MPNIQNIELYRDSFSVISLVPKQSGWIESRALRIMASRSYVTAAIFLPVSLPRSSPLSSKAVIDSLCMHSSTCQLHIIHNGELVLRVTPNDSCLVSVPWNSGG